MSFRKRDQDQPTSHKRWTVAVPRVAARSRSERSTARPRYRSRAAVCQSLRRSRIGNAVTAAQRAAANAPRAPDDASHRGRERCRDNAALARARDCRRVRNCIHSWVMILSFHVSNGGIATGTATPTTGSVQAIGGTATATPRHRSRQARCTRLSDSVAEAPGPVLQLPVPLSCFGLLDIFTAWLQSMQGTGARQSICFRAICGYIHGRLMATDFRRCRRCARSRRRRASAA
jgi:hypothetical protein